MDIRDKIIKAFSDCFPVDYARLDSDEGITGFIVSPKFQDMSMLDRQILIDKSLRKADSLTSQERRQVLMIAGLTPAEYNTVGARIRVHKVEELAGGTVRVLLHGAPSDAKYVRAVLTKLKDVQATDVEQVPGAIGVLMSFQAQGTPANPLTKAKALRILKKDRYVQVMSDA